MTHRHHQDCPREDANDDRRNAVQQVSRVADHHGHGLAAELRQVDSPEKTHRHSNYDGDQNYHATADNSVRHPATQFARRERQFGEKIPVHRSETVRNVHTPVRLSMMLFRTLRRAIRSISPVSIPSRWLPESATEPWRSE